jgi:hypothetical protein
MNRPIGIEALRTAWHQQPARSTPAESVVAHLPDQATGVGDKPHQPLATFGAASICRSLSDLARFQVSTLPIRKPSPDVALRRW